MRRMCSPLARSARPPSRAPPLPQSLGWLDGALVNLTGGACNLTAIAGGTCLQAPPGLGAWAEYTLAWDKQQVGSSSQLATFGSATAVVARGRQQSGSASACGLRCTLAGLVEPSPRTPVPGPHRRRWRRLRRRGSGGARGGPSLPTSFLRATCRCSPRRGSFQHDRSATHRPLQRHLQQLLRSAGGCVPLACMPPPALQCSIPLHVPL